MQHNLPQVDMPILGFMPSPCGGNSILRKCASNRRAQDDLQILIVTIFCPVPIIALTWSSNCKCIGSAAYFFFSYPPCVKRFHILFMCIAWQSFAQSEDNGTKIACTSWHKDIQYGQQLAKVTFPLQIAISPFLSWVVGMPARPPSHVLISSSSSFSSPMPRASPHGFRPNAGCHGPDIVGHNSNKEYI